MKNNSFKNAQRKAEEYANDPKKAKKLLQDAINKSQQHKNGPLSEVWVYLQGLIRLIKAYYSKKYREIPWQTVVIGLAAIIYFVSPIDAIFDFIPVFGMIDDVAVLSAVFASIKTDIEKFLSWEKETQSGIQETEYEEIKSEINQENLNSENLN